MKLLRQHIEALIFASEQPVTPDELISVFKSSYGWELEKEDIMNAVYQLKEKFNDEDHAFELSEIAGGFQFLSKKDFHSAIHIMLQLKEKKRLSTAALETLAIIAYKQPISKPELEQIRGVSCDYSIQKLLEKELIVISGKSDGPGRPILYATSKNFMEHFGLRSVKDLPKLKDIQSLESNEIGIPSELSDESPVEGPVSDEEVLVNAEEHPLAENTEGDQLEDTSDTTSEEGKEE